MDRYKLEITFCKDGEILVEQDGKLIATYQSLHNLFSAIFDLVDILESNDPVWKIRR